MPGRGRPHNTDTPLGQTIRRHKLTVYQVAGMAGISPRLMTEYLAGRRRIRDEHIPLLADTIGCDAEEIVGDVSEDITDSTGRVIALRNLQDEQAELRRQAGIR